MCILYIQQKKRSGNSKGARSSLRASTFGDGHNWVSPSVFDSKLKDEFRKQGPDFHGALVCTVREADAFELDEKLCKTWTAGDGIACRLPHAVHTPMLAWGTTGKFWEINTASTPKIRSVTESSFARRIRAVEKTATFTADPDKVDARKKCFLADGKLEEKASSPHAVWCYLRTVLLPWQKKRTADEARLIIMNPAPAVRRDTDKFLHILTTNQEHGADGLRPTRSLDTVSSNSGPVLVEDILESWEFKTLFRAHEVWETKSSAKDWMIQQTSFIPGARWPGTKKTRLEYFDEAVASRGNFLFRKRTRRSTSKHLTRASARCSVCRVVSSGDLSCGDLVVRSPRTLSLMARMSGGQTMTSSLPA